jgi:predicted component of type VI protein secretion system
MKRHQLVKAKQCCREIKDAAEKMIELREQINRPLEDLGGLMQELESQTKFERAVFEVVRNSGQVQFAAYNAELLENFCDAHLPQAASRERVMSIRNGGAVSDIPIGQTLRDAGVNIDLVEAN